MSSPSEVDPVEKRPLCSICEQPMKPLSGGRHYQNTDNDPDLEIFGWYCATDRVRLVEHWTYNAYRVVEDVT